MIFTIHALNPPSQDFGGRNIREKSIIRLLNKILNTYEFDKFHYKFKSLNF